jgi:hypothetical protein
MRRSGSDLSISARGRQPKLRKLRVVGGMNKVMRDAGMVRLFFEQLIQNANRLLGIFQRRVMVRCRRQQCESIENRRLVVIRILLRNLLHRLRIGGRTASRDPLCRIRGRKR